MSGSIREYQLRCWTWINKCWPKSKIPTDIMERNHRFFEEACELVQSLDMTEDEAIKLVRYVWVRPKGEPVQEIGGVGNTFACLCNAHAINMESALLMEMDRVEQPEMMEKIRRKHAAKPKFGPLPQ